MADSSKTTTIQPIIERLKSTNKYNETGDYLSSFEKRLIPSNKKMQVMFEKSIMVSANWFRNNCKDLILPQNIDVVIGIFYTLPRCGICGMYNNLWLNLCDGFIGCGRQQWDGTGGKGCALLHYADLKEEIKENHGSDYPKTEQWFSTVVKLGTINKYGADVFDYDKDIMVMEALFIDDEDDQDLAVNKDKNKRYFQPYGNDNAICLEELQPALAYWGIQMGGMYKFEQTMAEKEIAMNKDFLENNPWASQFMH
mmetsp:Transcript_11466/g.10268  ORF Transcript_11466/g.10268 Transcript_11466/m.10268 type:complete len:254 (-) Transcript_11466:119-880(-)